MRGGEGGEDVLSWEAWEFALSAEQSGDCSAERGALTLCFALSCSRFDRAICEGNRRQRKRSVARNACGVDAACHPCAVEGHGDVGCGAGEGGEAVFGR